MKKHIHTVHEGHKDYKCVSCGKSYSVAGSLKKHIHTVHEGHKDYKCESCGKSYSVARSLKKHILTYHAVDESGSKSRKIKNWRPSKNFIEKFDKGSTEVNVSDCHNYINYSCKLCEKSFHVDKKISSKLIMIHFKKVHEIKRTHVCAICDRDFQSQPDLRNHTIKNHEKQKTFSCNKCDKWFTGKPYLTRHMENVHKGMKRFKCDSCNTAYSQSGELKTQCSNS